jgi:uncharacterized protein YciI
MFTLRLPILISSLILTLTCTISSAPALAQVKEQGASQFDAEYAKRLGADEMGMRNYVLVILKTGPNKIAAGKERDDMFAGHFANMKRLASEGKLVLAGPLDGVDGWRGLFVFLAKEISDAKAWTETDPVIVKGAMVAEYHKWYGSAAVLEVNQIHSKIAQKSF